MSALDRRRRIAWASRIIRAADAPIPRYGSADWCQLPDTSRVKVASVVVAAEAWQQDCDETPARLATEIATGRGAHEQLDREDFAIMAAGVRKLASVPTYAELSDRRGEPDRAARARDRSTAIRDGWASGGDAA